MSASAITRLAANVPKDTGHNAHNVEVRTECKWCDRVGTVGVDIGLRQPYGFVCIDQDACDERDCERSEAEAEL